MIRILFMPLLQIPSGHHHAAESVKSEIQHSKGLSEEFHYDKLEILSHCYGKLESIISSVYIQSIHKIPHVYSQLYKFVSVKGINRRNYQIYERMFLKKALDVLRKKNPHIVICTHALPSYLLSRLKEKKLWSGSVINVYTDYFVNDLWGIDHINYHFVPSLHIKKELMEKGVAGHQIIVTGIPVDPVFKEITKEPNNKKKLMVLISGGNMGAGSIKKLLHKLNPSGSVIYYVLCGKNEALYHNIEQMPSRDIKAFSYIKSKEKMNQLYDKADAIITKPGGVTITECLWKRLPIFVYEALPGQEEFNLQYLKDQGLVFHINDWASSIDLETQLITNLKQHNPELDTFHNELDRTDITKIIERLV